MKCIYHNFDTISLSIQGRFPEEVLQLLRQAKEKALIENQASQIEIGKNPISINVKEMGAKGGYAFVFSTGIDGETWLVKDSKDSAKWNIKITIGSLALMTSGYKTIKKRLYKLLENFGVISKAYIDENGLLRNTGIECLSRIDYCFDFIMDKNFQPNMEHIICHNRFNKSMNGKKHIETIRIGQMPFKQIAIYNKSAEIQVSKKSYWWEKWDIDKDNFDQSIWRLEIRAAKEELNKWGIKSFSKLEEALKTLLLKTMEDIRYTQPTNDQTHSRWPDSKLWVTVKEIIRNELLDFSDHGEKQTVIEDYKENIQSGYLERINGNIIGYFATEYEDTITVDNIQDRLKKLEKIIKYKIKNNLEVYQKKFKSRQEAYLFKD